jgi:hypothetical protein
LSIASPVKERDLRPPGRLTQRSGDGGSHALHAKITVVINRSQVTCQQRGRAGGGQGDVVDHLFGTEDAD